MNVNGQDSFSFMNGPQPVGRTTRTTFDKARGEKAKTYGMDIAALNRAGLLEMTRQAMVELALSRESREVNADDISRWLISHGKSPSELGPAIPSVFKSSDWQFTGRWKKSARISNHARVNRIWKLR